MKKLKIYEAFWSEVKRIGDTRSLFVITVILPPILFLFFGFLYQSALVRGIPIAIIDEDNSTISRLIVTSFSSSPSFKISGNYVSLKDAESGLIKGEVDAIIMLPMNLERDLKKGKQVNPVVFANGLNVIKSNYILSDATKIFKTVSGGVLLKKFRSGGMTETQAMDVISPIRFDMQILYNSNYSYVDFLLPGLCVFVIFMSLSLAGATVFNHSGASESSSVQGIWGSFLALIGKTIPYILICIAEVAVLLGVVFPLFDITMRGSVAGLFLYTFLFGMSSLLLGMLVSVILKNVMLSTQVVLFLTTPAFVFSGLTYPLWAMPEAHRIFSHVIPYTQFLDGFIRIYLMGENLSDIGKSIDLILAGIVAPLVLIPLINFTKGIIIKRKMRNQR
mgnify:CR=1 FL=1